MLYLIPPQIDDVLISLQCGSSVIFDPLHNICCDFEVDKNSELSKFNSVLEFMKRIPIQKL
ncbi:hypothetical protein Hanom_Chr17g01591211 [Helianthus anomalus]